MKKIFVTISLLLFYSQLKAQLIVIDPGHIVATIANGGVLKKIDKTTNDINQVSNSINGFVSSINNLQHSIDNALYTVRRIVHGSAFGNIDAEIGLHGEIRIDMGSYLSGVNPNDYAFLQEGYSNSNVVLGSNMLHESLNIPLDRQLPVNGQAAKTLVAEQQQSKLLFNAMSGKKAIQIALSYNQLADVMLQKANDLNTLLKKGKNTDGEENSLKMNEAERLQLLASTSDYVRKSLELKLACDQIIRQEVLQSKDSDKAMGSYRMYNSLFNYYK